MGKKGRPKKYIYTRRCRECGELHETIFKNGKKCLKCMSPELKKRTKTIIKKRSKNN